jgi:hypothetical protein
LQKIKVWDLMVGLLSSLFYFFDLVGDDLLEMVEESRIRGEVVRGLNSTFLALIPKVNKPTSFDDFRPISLCNLCYKLISKIIANRIKPILSRSMSEEQLGFLKGRQIQDTIGTAQECLHSIKLKKLKAIVLKLDLKKAYDCINWDNLRLILIQTGFGIQITNWIMSCVSTSTFVVLAKWGDYFILSKWQRIETRVSIIPFAIYIGNGGS